MPTCRRTSSTPPRCSFLLDLARECELEARRDAMLRGEIVNATEGRAVLHTALRAPRGAGPFSDEVHARARRHAGLCRTGARATSGLTDIVNIGIGGSDLGPQMVVPALDAYGHAGKRLHFVSNVDGHDITPVLRAAGRRSETLFIVASKTFTTQETMANARVARDWFLASRAAPTSRATSSPPPPT